MNRLTKFLCLLALGWLAGCATGPRHGAGPAQTFVFGRDSFAFPNELEWEYTYDSTSGKMRHHPRQPAPAFAQRCFPVIASARKFLYHACFAPALPRLSAAEYQRKTSEVLARSPTRPSPETKRIVIPGYAGLCDFSRENELRLKTAIGGKWQSYVQRGNWRMLFPFTRRGQQRVAEKLREKVARHQAPIIHLFTFPALTINHALLLYAVAADEKEIRFAAYDPNDPAKPAEISFDRTTRTFQFPRNGYFAGGTVKVYEIYTGCCY